jgi:hypothetical protein
VKPFTFTRARSFGGRYARQFLASGARKDQSTAQEKEQRDTAAKPLANSIKEKPMILKRLASIDGYTGGDWEPQDFDSYDIAKLAELGVDAAVYWYSHGCYEGSGELLMRINGAWHHRDCGHCSCYGPLGDEGLALGEGRTLVEIWESFTTEMKSRTAHLFVAAREI